jgi:hypothetical protein
VKPTSLKRIVYRKSIDNDRKNAKPLNGVRLAVFFFQTNVNTSRSPCEFEAAYYANQRKAAA